MAPHSNESAGVQHDHSPLRHIVTPIGMLGYGFADAEIETALAQTSSEQDCPVAFILDSGSADSGPSKLALGTMTCPSTSYVRDLRRLLRLGVQYTMFISSAGGDGSDEHVELLSDSVKELAQERERLYG